MQSDNTKKDYFTNLWSKEAKMLLFILNVFVQCLYILLPCVTLCMHSTMEATYFTWVWSLYCQPNTFS